MQCLERTIAGFTFAATDEIAQARTQAAQSRRMSQAPALSANCVNQFSLNQHRFVDEDANQKETQEIVVNALQSEMV
eukprot:g5387.t1